MFQRCLTVRPIVLSILLTALALPFPSKAHASADDIVLYAADAPVFKGHWSKKSSSSGAGGALAGSSDQGWASADAPLASPANYFEMTFDAPAGTTYRVWLRMRATNDSKWNDAVWVQFSDSTLTSGQSAYRIGTTSAMLVNLERCGGCGVAAWGWQNDAYWLSQPTEVRFASSGTHTIRVQTREDGVEVDQIVLSPSTYRSAAPGQQTSDTTILPKTATSSGAASGGSTPLGGKAWALPGIVQARDFDEGGNGVGYKDTTSGNSGGAYRQTDVDLESDGLGGHNVGWTSAGEWLNYTVQVATTGTYVVRARVASPNSGVSLGVAFDKSGVSKSISVPNSGGWKNWRDVEFTTALTSGQQVLRLSFPQGGVNVGRIEVEASGSAPAEPSGSAGPYGGTAKSLPGTVDAANFDSGPSGVSYYDTTSGNSGGTYRSTDVDIQSSSAGGYNVAWTAAGEWLNYTVNVASAGSYTVTLKVATPSSGNSIQVGFNQASNVWQAVGIPNTGGWQNWSNVSLPVTLGAGTQQLTIKFNTGGVNLRSVSVTSGSGSSSPPPPSSGSGGNFRVMTWNIQQGRTKSGSYDPVAQVKFIVAQNPDVVLLQEINTTTENMPARYKSLLEQQTGQSWYLQWAPIMNSKPTEGNVVLTRLPVSSSSYHQMHATSDWNAMYSNRSVAQATVKVGGVPVDVFSTHLDYYNTSHRTAQLQDMMAWAEKFSAKRIVGGDFNSWWGEYWIVTMMADYYDTWQDVTGSNQNGYTVNNAVRFDYLFFAKESNGKIRATKVFVPGTSLSDHNPVVADYTVSP